jgi:prophage antirepressor-like protein
MTFQIIKNETLNCELKYVLSSEGDIWFRAKTVATVLGYKNTRKAIRDHIDSDDKSDLGAFEGGNAKTPLTNNEKNTIMINESGLYSLIIASKLETAKKFKRWVTSIVLPSIRKTGSFKMPEVVEEPDSEDDEDLPTCIVFTGELNDLTDGLEFVKNCCASEWQKAIYREMIEYAYVNDKCIGVVMLNINHLQTDRKRIDALPFQEKTKQTMYKRLFAKASKIQAYPESGSLEWVQ